MFACSQLMHLFFDCYLSQRLTDCSTAVQENMYVEHYHGERINQFLYSTNEIYKKFIAEHIQIGIGCL